MNEHLDNEYADKIYALQKENHNLEFSIKAFLASNVAMQGRIKLLSAIIERQASKINELTLANDVKRHSDKVCGIHGSDELIAKPTHA